MHTSGANIIEIRDISAHLHDAEPVQVPQETEGKVYKPDFIYLWFIRGTEPETTPWELGVVRLSGPRLRKDGSTGQVRYDHEGLVLGGGPGWLDDLILNLRPADS